MAVVTISREIESGGLVIGREVADRLGWHFADKETIHRVFHQFGFMPFDKVYESPTSFWDRFDNMRRMTLENLNNAILALAHHGNMVIVGRGSYAVLADLADVVHVRIRAPFEYRVRKYMDQEYLVDREKAEEFIEDHDDQRAGFVETTYNASWDSASNFDLVINTELVPRPMAVDWIVALVNHVARLDLRGLPTTRDLAVDKFLAAAVCGALDCDKEH